MLKQINTEDLKPGKKYLIEMEFKKEEGELYPLNFTDADNANYCFSKAQPIYTLEEDQPIVATIEQTGIDPELEMLVNVATALYVAHGTTADGVNTFMPDREAIAREAAELIAACKKIKEGER